MATDPRQVNKSFTIMGSSFVPGAGALIDKLKPNQRIELLREPTNEHDKNAVKVMWGNRQLGWLPRGLAAAIAPLIDSGVNVIVRKAPPLPKFGAYRGVLELAYIPPLPTQDVPNADSEQGAGAPGGS